MLEAELPTINPPIHPSITGNLQLQSQIVLQPGRTHHSSAALRGCKDKTASRCLQDCERPDLEGDPGEERAVQGGQRRLLGGRAGLPQVVRRGAQAEVGPAVSPIPGPMAKSGR